MSYAFPSAVGELSPALSTQTAQRLRAQRDQVDDKASFWQSLTVKSVVGSLAAAPAGGMLMLAMPLSMGALPLLPALLVGASVVMAATAAIGSFRAGALTRKSDKLHERAAYLEQTASLQAVSAMEKINGSGLLGRLRDRRDQARLVQPKQEPSFGRKASARM